MAAAPIRSRTGGLSAAHGLSSIIFWWRRCAEHSRSNRWTVWPCVSANTWISTCRGRSISRSTYSVSSPNGGVALRAARRARASADLTGVRDDLHADAAATRRRLDQPGEPDALSPRPKRGIGLIGRRLRRHDGTPAPVISRRAPIFDPIFSSAEAGGPTKISPASSHARAKGARSERKP